MITKFFKKKDPSPERNSVTVTAPDKEAARKCLFAADQYVKDGLFEKARLELEKGKKFDPTNIYIAAFKDRIAYFEQQRKKEVLEAARQKAAEISTQPEMREKSKQAPNIPEEKIEIKMEPQEQAKDQRNKLKERERAFSPEQREAEQQVVQREDQQKKISEEVIRKFEEALRQTKEELLRKVEQEIQKLADERKLFEEEQKQLDEKLRKIHEEVRLREDQNRKTIKEEIRTRPEEEYKRLDEAKQKAEIELLHLKEEIQKKANEEAIRKLEQEFHDWQESERKRQQAEIRKESEAKAKDETQAKKIQQMVERAHEFLFLKQYGEALVEITKVYALDPTLEEVHILEAEIRRVESEEKKKQVEQKLEEMKHQIDELSRALEQEKKAREEINKLNVQRALTQFRAAFEKAWVNGAPDAKTAEELHNFALSLTIPESVEQSIRREVKLAMYGRAVKEAIAKRHLMRNSSSTLEWLRKVYEITLDEYLEYESKFLIDLVADQYKGSILLVSNDDETKASIVGKLKSSGYAVVLAETPEEALEKIEKIYPNFIFCEMEFSKESLSGIKFLHILRSNSKYSYLPFILFCDPDRVHQLQSSDFRPNEGYMEKPVNVDHLLEIMGTKLQVFKEYVSSLS